MKHFRFLALFVPLLFLNACTPVGMATGAGATAGMAATSEGGIGNAVTDFGIRVAINDLWFKYDVETFRKLELTVNQGRVLITGIVQDPEDRVEAVRLAWQPKGVKQVINEVRVAKSEGIMGYARDTWITTRLRTEITFDRAIYSINYSIDTVQGTVYLMGVAQNNAELNKVIETARTIPDVKQVVSYVKIRGEDINTTPSGSGPVSTGAAGTSLMPTDYSAPSSAEPVPADVAPPSAVSVQPVEAVPLE